MNEMEIGRLDVARARSRTGVRCASSARARTSTTSQPPCGRSRHAASSTAPTRLIRRKRAQGTLQLLYEYQTMISSLTGMQVSNASLYDGGSALAEACLMAVRAQSQIEVDAHPDAYDGSSALPARWRMATAGNQGLRFEEVPFADRRGAPTLLDALATYDGPGHHRTRHPAAEFFRRARRRGCARPIGHGRATSSSSPSVNPTSLAIAQAAEWGPGGAAGSDGRGVDIAVGEGQPLGVPLSSGGPYFGFITTRMEHVRQMPGRIVGRTVDRQWQARIHADAAGSRAAHPPREGDLEHLHQSGFARHRARRSTCR